MKLYPENVKSFVTDQLVRNTIEALQKESPTKLQGAKLDKALAIALNDQLQKANLPAVLTETWTRFRRYEAGIRFRHHGTPAPEHQHSAAFDSDTKQRAFLQVRNETTILVRRLGAILQEFRSQQPHLPEDVLVEATKCALQPDSSTVHLQTMMAEALLAKRQLEINRIISSTHLLVTEG